MLNLVAHLKFHQIRSSAMKKVIAISALLIVIAVTVMYGTEISIFVFGEKVEYDYCDIHDCRDTKLM